MKLRGTLAPGEYVIAVTRSHASSLFPALWSGLGAAMAFSFASAIYADSKIFGWLGYLLALLLLWRCLRRVLRWARTGFFVTNVRVVIQRGLKVATQTSLPLAVIEGIDAKPTTARLAQSAHLNVYVQGVVHVLRSIPRGQAFSQIIYSAQRNLLHSFNAAARY